MKVEKVKNSMKVEYDVEAMIRKGKNSMKAEYDVEVMIGDLKKRISFYKYGLVSLDDVLGYMQALHDIGLLKPNVIVLIISDLIK